MALSSTRILFIVPHLLLIIFTIFATFQSEVASRPLTVNHHQSRVYQLHPQALVHGSAPGSCPGGSGNHDCGGN
ncbi:unnamed protein product [Lupinus luteus]|uniref:Transmembrane protein n=1 Tax=Lupinus luteus TaxID=3873 RepID=A0AAV1WL39_LUPLU